MIKSKQAFTYGEAQIRIDDTTLTDSLTESLRGLNRLAKIFKQKRLDAGALTLASVEVGYILNLHIGSTKTFFTFGGLGAISSRLRNGRPN